MFYGLGLSNVVNFSTRLDRVVCCCHSSPRKQSPVPVEYEANGPICGSPRRVGDIGRNPTHSGIELPPSKFISTQRAIMTHRQNVLTISIEIRRIQTCNCYPFQLLCSLCLNVNSVIINKCKYCNSLFSLQVSGNPLAGTPLPNGEH